MTKVNFKSPPVSLKGDLPSTGSIAPDFELIAKDLNGKTLMGFKGNTLILNIFLNLNTPVCAASVKKFNELATKLEGVKILAISKDLLFAHHRFCSGEGIENDINLSGFKCDSGFGDNYGVEMIDGPLEGLFARAVIIIDNEERIKYTQLVPEITEEPDYDDVLKAI